MLTVSRSAVDFSGLGGIWDGPSHSGNVYYGQMNQYFRYFLGGMDAPVRRRRTVAHLKTCLQEEWDKITPETLHHLVSSVPKRLLSVVKRNGNITKWQMLYCPNFFWNVLQVWMTGKDVYLQMTWSWPDKTWNILCSYCLQWNTSQSKFRNHYFLFLFAFSILSQLFLIWGCIIINTQIKKMVCKHVNCTQCSF